MAAKAQAAESEARRHRQLRKVGFERGRPRPDRVRREAARGELSDLFVRLDEIIVKRNT